MSSPSIAIPAASTGDSGGICEPQSQVALPMLSRMRDGRRSRWTMFHRWRRRTVVLGLYHTVPTPAVEQLLGRLCGTRDRRTPGAAMKTCVCGCPFDVSFVEFPHTSYVPQYRGLSREWCARCMVRNRWHWGRIMTAAWALGEVEREAQTLLLGTEPRL